MGLDPSDSTHFAHGFGDMSINVSAVVTAPSGHNNNIGGTGTAQMLANSGSVELALHDYYSISDAGISDEMLALNLRTPATSDWSYTFRTSFRAVLDLSFDSYYRDGWLDGFGGYDVGFSGAGGGAHFGAPVNGRVFGAVHRELAPNTVYTVSVRNQLASAAAGHLHDNGYYGGSTDTFFDYKIAAVPEPASWAMLIVGFGLTGTTVRHRRHVPSIVDARRSGGLPRELPRQMSA